MKSAPLLPAFCLGCKTTVESGREEKLKSRGANPPDGLQTLGFGTNSYHLPWRRRRRRRWRNVSRGWRSGCVLPVHHITRLLSVSQATTFAVSASHYYNKAIYSTSIFSPVLSFCVCFTLCKLILSKPNSVPPPFFFIFLGLFVYHASPHPFLSIFSQQALLIPRYFYPHCEPI